MSETTISLFDSVASVPDPRSPLGKRHPLNAILTLCSVSMLCGCRSLFAIAQFGRDRGKHFAAALGFTRQTTPCCTTLHNLFLALDKVAFESEMKTTNETVFGITSLPRERADASQLLKLVRAHWGIENKVFHVRDQTMGEDACRVRKRSAPTVLSALRNGVLNVLQRRASRTVLLNSGPSAPTLSRPFMQSRGNK